MKPKLTTLQFITISLGIFGLGMIYSWLMTPSVKNKPTIRKTTSGYESTGDDYDFKVKKHKTWYGDTMLVTVDTTYYFRK